MISPRNIGALLMPFVITYRVHSLRQTLCIPKTLYNNGSAGLLCIHIACIDPVYVILAMVLRYVDRYQLDWMPRCDFWRIRNTFTQKVHARVSVTLLCRPRDCKSNHVACESNVSILTSEISLVYCCD